MKKYLSSIIPLRSRTLVIISLVLTLSWPQVVRAQGDGARFYWKGLVGTNAVPVIANSLSGNANPLDPSHNVVPGADFQAAMSMAGYAKFLPVLKRSAMVSVLVPMGRISGNINLNGLDYSSTARGFGDPMVQFTINILGPKAIMNIPDMLRSKPRFLWMLLAALLFRSGNMTIPVQLISARTGGMDVLGHLLFGRSDHGFQASAPH